MFEKEIQQQLELIDDKDFIRWLILPDEQSDGYWHDIMRKDSEKRKNIESLRNLIAKVHVNEKELSADEKMQMWEEIARRSIYRRRNRIRKLRIWRYAAASLLLLIGTTFMYKWMNNNRNIDYQSIVSSVDNGGQSDIRLILPDKQTVIIKEDNAELIYDKEGKINITEETISPVVVENHSETTKTPSKAQLSTLIVPFGKRTSVILSDGTKVWLNSGSRLIYPAVFEGKTREIFVEGEMFLEVAANREKPFVVKTGQLLMEVLGTSFNINAYGDEKNYSVVVVSGSVAVKNKTGKTSAVLKPNQMYDYDADNGQHTVQDVDIYDYICWKYGFFHFTNEELSAVFERLHKYYNINIEYDKQQISDITCSGKLDLKEDIENVLNSVALTADFQYEIRDDKIIITKKTM
ncbi:MAG: FecR family protein [Tannerella sp.]|jgi:ferric-dicitrate binding protein FerR (iron transport regulator)|nr:FecR family protein [Tannerella sp.]